MTQRKRKRRQVTCLCMDCLGIGKYQGKKCEPCNGTGNVEKWINEEVSE